MNITKQEIEEQVQSIKDQRAECLARLQALAGCEKLCNHWLEKIATKEFQDKVAEDEAKAKAQEESLKQIAKDAACNGSPDINPAKVAEAINDVLSEGPVSRELERIESSGVLGNTHV